MLLTNYKHTQPTLGLSVTFVFNIEYIYIFTHTYITAMFHLENIILLCNIPKYLSYIHR